MQGVFNVASHWDESNKTFLVNKIDDHYFVIYAWEFVNENIKRTIIRLMIPFL